MTSELIESAGNQRILSEPLSLIEAWSVDSITWIMVGVWSPSTEDERGVFTCSISFPNKWDIQVEN